MYAYWLGGKDHFAVDRRAADHVAAIAPWVPEAVRANRAFVCRAVEVMACQGIGQFLDIGCGLPVTEPVHEVARQVVPAARVVYADHDEVVLAYARALLETDPGVTVVPGDARRPGDLLADRRVRAHLDLARPIGVVLTAVLHFLDDAEAARCLAGLRAVLPTGSCVAVSHAGVVRTADGEPGRVERQRIAATQRAARAYAELVHPFRLRDDAQVATLLDGFTLLEPGVVDVASWRLPARPQPPLPLLVGLGRVGA